MNYKSITLFLILLLSFHLGEAQKKQFVLSGMIGGLQNQKIYLLKDEGERKTLIDSTEAQNGEFEFNGTINHPFAARLQIKRYRELPIFISPGEMTLFVHKDSIKFNVVPGVLTGSPAQDQLEDFLNQKKNSKRKQMEMSNILDTLNAERNPQLKKELLANYRKNAKFEKNYILNNAESPVAQYLFYKGFYAGSLHIEDMENLVNSVSQNNTSIYIQNMKKRIEMYKSMQPGGQFPDIQSKTLNGEEFQLKDMRGKYVLVYMWRAWNKKNRQKHLTKLRHLAEKYPHSSLEIVNIIRYSSMRFANLKVKNMAKPWVPTPTLNGLATEIQSCDGELEIVHYLRSNFDAFLLDPQGKVVVHLTREDDTQLEKELNKILN